MAARIKPITTKRPKTDLERSAAIWEKKRAHRLAQWRQTTHRYKKTDPRRKKAWSNYRHADEEWKKARGKLLYRQQHPQLTKRRRCLDYARKFSGKVKENPAGSNRGGLITTWELKLANGGRWLVGQPWCGTFVANMLLHVGVKGVSGRLASVALIESDARAGRGPFSSWTRDSRSAHQGDLVVLFGRGVHVGLVDRVDMGQGLVHTVEGNTSSGSSGSQANGGGVYRRARRLRDVWGYALVHYPGDRR